MDTYNCQLLPDTYKTAHKFLQYGENKCKYKDCSGGCRHLKVVFHYRCTMLCSAHGLVVAGNVIIKNPPMITHSSPGAKGQDNELSCMRTTDKATACSDRNFSLVGVCQDFIETFLSLPLLQ